MLTETYKIDTYTVAIVMSVYSMYVWIFFTFRWYDKR